MYYRSILFIVLSIAFCIKPFDSNAQIDDPNFKKGYDLFAHANFFEARATEYTRAATTGTWEQVFKNMDAQRKSIE